MSYLCDTNHLCVKFQFLETQRALSIKANPKSKSSLPFVHCMLHPNSSLGSLDTCNQWSEKIVKQYNGSKSTAMYWTQIPHRQHNKLQKLIISKNRKYLIPMRNTGNVLQTQNVENNETISFLYNSRVISSESLCNSKESNSNGILLSSNDVSILKTNSQSPMPQDEDKPSQEKLQHIFDCLSEDVCHMKTV